ncbi:hypothetical protein BMR11_16455, partial [Methylococcaceae bacterium CS5]
NNGPTPSGDYQPSRSLSMAGSVCSFIKPCKGGSYNTRTCRCIHLGNIYDVTFLQDDRGASFNSYNDIMPGITFTIAGEAESAVNAIVAAAGPGYDYTPGGGGDTENGFRVPFSFTDDSYFYMTGIDKIGTFGPFEQPRDGDSVFSFATFELSNNIPIVPEPGSLVLLSLGLLGFTARKVKRNT